MFKELLRIPNHTFLRTYFSYEIISASVATWDHLNLKRNITTLRIFLSVTRLHGCCLFFFNL